MVDTGEKLRNFSPVNLGQGPTFCRNSKALPVRPLEPARGWPLAILAAPLAKFS
jgi:hypothetical protein